jgi:hypothetical protein
MRLKGYGLQAALRQKKERLQKELLLRNSAPDQLQKIEEGLIQAEKRLENLTEDEKKFAIQAITLLQEMGLGTRSTKLIAEYLHTIDKMQTFKDKERTRYLFHKLYRLITFSLHRKKVFGLIPPERNAFIANLVTQTDKDSITPLEALSIFIKYVSQLQATRQQEALKNIQEICSYLDLPMEKFQAAINAYLSPKDLFDQRKKGIDNQSSLKNLVLILLCDQIYHKDIPQNILDQNEKANKILQAFQICDFPRHNASIFYAYLNALIGYAPFYQTRKEHLNKLHLFIQELEKTAADETKSTFVELLLEISYKDIQFYRQLIQQIKEKVNNIDTSSDATLKKVSIQLESINEALCSLIENSNRVETDHILELKSDIRQTLNLYNLKIYAVTSLHSEGRDLNDEKTAEQIEYENLIECSIEESILSHSFSQAEKTLQSIANLVDFEIETLNLRILSLLNERFSTLAKEKEALEVRASALGLYNLIESAKILQLTLQILISKLQNSQSEHSEFTIKKLNSILEKALYLTST